MKLKWNATLKVFTEDVSFNSRYNGIYWYVGWRACGFVVVAGENVLSYPVLWGMPFELFDAWRSWDLRIPLQRMYALDLLNGGTA